MLLPTPLATAATFAPTLAAAAADSATTLATDGANGLAPIPPFVTGVVCYVGGFVALAAWERWAVPALQLRSSLPDAPLLAGDVSEAERAVPFVTPWTADLPVPPPPYDELACRPDFRVASRGAVGQYIKAGAPPAERPGLVEASQSWERYYGDRPITIFKRRVR